MIRSFPASSSGILATNNAAEFGLGPLGTWTVTICGTWAVRGPTLATVKFDRVILQLCGFLWLRFLGPSLEFATPSSRVAEFQTTYVSPSMRVSRGLASGGIFVFTKEGEDTTRK